MVAHGGMSAAGSFIQTPTMVEVATGWTECPAGQSRREPRRRGAQAPRTWRAACHASAAQAALQKSVHMPSKLDPHAALIESWLATEPQLTAIAIISRLGE